MRERPARSCRCYLSVSLSDVSLSVSWFGGAGWRGANGPRTGLARFPAGSPAGELRRERGTGRARRRSFVARHDEDGVVAGDRADDVDEAGAVERAREKLRRAG